jgi:hypothetical protein
MRRALNLLVLAGLSMSLGACGSRRAVTDDPADRTTLVVKNDSYLDHNIYLLQGAQRVRMGTARGLTTSRFTIPSQYIFGVTSVQFLADPIGSRVTPVSERLNVIPGDEVHLQIRGT